MFSELRHEPPCLLPDSPDVDRDLQAKLDRDYERFARDGLPADLGAYLLDEYRLDVTAEYAGVAIPNPWGKASGQLSMTARQVEDDVRAGLGFVVLKTVIAQDAGGVQSMRDWAFPESRMLAEPIVGRSGESGWTISWKGRGWWQPFEEYLRLITDARRIAAEIGDQRSEIGGQRSDVRGLRSPTSDVRPQTLRTLIVPSCKFHLPTPEETDWNAGEYDYTVSRLLEAWHAGGGQRSEIGGQRSEVGGQRSEVGGQLAPISDLRLPTSDLRPVMPLEKDFSPTLAGSDRAAAQSKILEWLRVVPRLVHEAAVSAGHPVALGLKIFNAMFDDDFQRQMLRAIHEPAAQTVAGLARVQTSDCGSSMHLNSGEFSYEERSNERAAFFVYGNRLFDPDREFDGHRGIAYGGPDLSDRNLRVLSAFREDVERGEVNRPLLPFSATGNITTGRMAVEYALRGASTFQLHTFFQLPADQYTMTAGSKTAKALHELYFHPRTGFIVWLHHAARKRGLSDRPVRFLDVAAGRRSQS